MFSDDCRSKDYRDDPARPKPTELPASQTPVLATDGKALAHCAADIIRAHSPSELQAILESCPADMREAILHHQRIHGRKTERAASVGDRYGYNAPMRRPMRGRR